MQFLDEGLRARRRGAVAAAAVVTMLFTVTMMSAQAADDPLVARGRYLAMIAGCNDCHTPGYMVNNGQVDEVAWLTGDATGWHGPWGTTYPPNLRLSVQNLTEDQWLVFARSPRRPPMPWYALRDMTDEDVVAIYRYLKHLGPAGGPAPAALPPGQEPPEPVFRAPAAPPRAAH
jgi:mono/diheme cytochrome c family protein